MTELLQSPLFLSLAAGILIVLGTSFMHHWSRVRRAAGLGALRERFFAPRARDDEA